MHLLHVRIAYVPLCARGEGEGAYCASLAGEGMRARALVPGWWLTVRIVHGRGHGPCGFSHIARQGVGVVYVRWLRGVGEHT